MQNKNASNRMHLGRFYADISHFFYLRNAKQSYPRGVWLRQGGMRREMAPDTLLPR